MRFQLGIRLRLRRSNLATAPSQVEPMGYVRYLAACRARPTAPADPVQLVGAMD